MERIESPKEKQLNISGHLNALKANPIVNNTMPIIKIVIKIALNIFI
jgi:hypothetical protein